MNEKNVLGAILISPEVMDYCFGLVEPNDFADIKNKVIYEAMLHLYTNNIELDYSTLHSRLVANKTIVDIDYLLEITNLLPTAEHYETYVKMLKDESNKRQLFKTMKYLYDNKALSSEEITNKLKAQFELLSFVNNHELEDISQGLEEQVNKIVDCVGLGDAIKSNYTELDRRVMILDGTYNIIAARAGFGKSAFMINLIKAFSEQNKKGVLISLEMLKDEIANRFLALESGVQLGKIFRRENLNSNEKRLIENAKLKIQNYGLKVYDKGGLKVEELYNIVRDLKRKGEIDVLYIDYIGLLDTHVYKDNRTQQVNYISRKIKQIAQEFKLPIIALHQMNRNAISSDSGRSREPNNTDLKGGGQLEQDAHSIMFLYKLGTEEEQAETNEVYLKIAKNRNGARSYIKYNFQADVMKFKEL